MNSKKEIKILIVTDLVENIVLINNSLLKGGFVFRSQRVETMDSLLAELQGETTDLIICDHGLRQLSGFAALSLAQQYCPDTPFIFFSAVHSPSAIRESFRRGAHDYVFTNQLEELSKVVVRVLDIAEERKNRRKEENQKKEAMLKLIAALDKVKTLPDLMTLCSACKKIRTANGEWENLVEFISRRLAVHFTHGICEACLKELYPEPLPSPPPAPQHK